MKYHVVFSEEARKNLKKMDKHQAKVILTWIQTHLEGCSNPYAFGKGLVQNLSGQWRYRVGDYRILTEIHQNEVVILVLKIDHRRKVYE